MSGIGRSIGVMDTTPKPGTTIECPCGWSRRPTQGESPDEALRYHRIQIHNDQTAVTAGRF